MSNNTSLGNESLSDWYSSIQQALPTVGVNLDGEYSNFTGYLGPQRDSLYVVIPITFIYMLIFITGVIGNISTCIVISKNKSLKTATNYYLFSLAISDFLLLLSGVPQEMYMVWSKYPYVFGEMFCVLRGLVAETSANATVLTITAFTVERYVAICHPFLSHTMSKLSRAVRLILLVWVISIGFAIPQALQFGVVEHGGIEQCVVKNVIIEHLFELSTFLFFVAPMSLITILYVLIGFKLRSSSLMPRTNGVTIQRRPNVSSFRQQNTQGTRRVLKMLVAVVVAFFLCWAPFHAQRLVAIYGNLEDHMEIYNVMTYISGIMYYVSTCINPLLYNIMSNKFRDAFKETLAKCCQVSARHYDKKRAYRVLSRSQRKRYGPQESTEYSGSSVRDESLYSTVTQKQSFDSVTLPRSQALKIAQLRNMHSNAFDSAYKVAADNTDRFMSGYHTSNQFGDTNNQHRTDYVYDNCPEHLVGNSSAQCNQQSNSINAINKMDLPSDDERYNVVFNKKDDVKISVVRGVAKVKTNDRSRVFGFFKNIFNWNKDSRNVGYYSPPLEHRSVDAGRKVVSIEKDIVHEVDEKDRHHDAISIDDGNISNCSLKNFDKNAFEDELEIYMAEVRLREKR
ncbi:pyrokinin-1 receptor-like [Bradysia coprophila]|uniref:pyrokinin-1 receptor-like n=1 Tax=Bradysia coprophila TaxID=38358 RepID=UPI00187D739D|nr:pyrokinin-1 receptor-like [Bradysia coprophila]